ncbi:MAG: 50S ribosomal protein L28 [bacterium]
MAKTCPICERGGIMGGGYSNRTRAEKYNPTGVVRKSINLQWAPKLGGGRMKICTRCIKGKKHLEK